MINANSIHYYEKALALLIASKSIILEDIVSVCNGNTALAKQIAYKFQDKGFVKVDAESPWIFNLDSEISATQVSVFNVGLVDDGKAEIFFQNGGFKVEFEKEQNRVEEENESKRLQKENLILQNENFEYAQTLREQESRIRILDEKLKEFEKVKNIWWVFERYWWAFTIGSGIIGYLIGK
ncbi:hypothetical protein I2I11_16910 [Pontibacter sp. 172403-2]|uniref:hypothetical protein n=1 Tax=Pontibacter rufus TaxID=2791028 RepID=UPI0018AF6FE0|nr:hypothetical protein [Pontibacter sp. 172403-2]MBF9254987.1 hypothetical protein [Pontibacter sp. 172403-2]